MFNIAQWMTGGWGVLIRLGLIALALGGMWAWGATWGYQHEEDKLDSYIAKDRAIGEAALQRNAQAKADGERNLKKAKDDYESDLTAIAGWSAGNTHVVRNAGAGGCPAAPVAPGVKKPDPPAEESVASGDDAGGTGPARPQGAPRLYAVTEEFMKDCAADAAQVDGFLEYVDTNHIPVE